MCRSSSAIDVRYVRTAGMVPGEPVRTLLQLLMYTRTVAYSYATAVPR